MPLSVRASSERASAKPSRACIAQLPQPTIASEPQSKPKIGQGAAPACACVQACRSTDAFELE